MTHDLIVNFVPTGMVPTKEMTEHVPLSVEEITEQVLQAYEIGITMVHLHARDESGKPTYKKEIYGLIMEQLRRYAPDLVICLSLSGRNFNTFEKRSEAIELCPDLGSLTLSSLNFVQQASVNDPEMIQALADRMDAYGVRPELEVFDLGMINYARYMIQRGVLKAPFYFNLLFGNIAGLQADLLHIGTAVRDLPAGAYWSLAGLGRDQLKTNAIAIAAGGGVRVGIEDNLYFDSGRKRLATNRELLLRVHDLAAVFERGCMPSHVLGAAGFYNSRVPDRTRNISVPAQ